MPIAIDRTPLGDWSLSGSSFVPTSRALLAHTIRLSNENLPDKLLTFTFANSDNSLTFHKSYLTNASPALRALVNGPFVEGNSDCIHLRYETYQAFAAIRRFLYLQKIDLSSVPTYMPLVADRWELHQLFHACTSFALSHLWPSLEHLLHYALPLMHLRQLSRRFNRYFAIKVAFHFQELASWLRESRGTPPDAFESSCLGRTHHSTETHLYCESQSPNSITIVELPLRAFVPHLAEFPNDRNLKNFPQIDSTADSEKQSMFVSLFESLETETCPLTSSPLSPDDCQEGRGRDFAAPPIVLSDFRKSVFWHALHKQRIISRLISLSRCYQPENNAHREILAQGVFETLKAVIPHDEAVKLMAGASERRSSVMLHERCRERRSMTSGVAELLSRENSSSISKSYFEYGVEEIHLTQDLVRMFPSHVWKIRMLAFKQTPKEALVDLRSVPGSAENGFLQVAVLIEGPLERAGITKSSLAVELTVTEIGCSGCSGLLKTALELEPVCVFRNGPAEKILVLCKVMEDNVFHEWKLRHGRGWGLGFGWQFCLKDS